MANVQAEELVEYVYLGLQVSRQEDFMNLTIQQVRVWRQGHVHEPRGQPGRCRLVRFRSSC